MRRNTAAAHTGRRWLFSGPRARAEGSAAVVYTVRREVAAAGSARRRAAYVAAQLLGLERQCREGCRGMTTDDRVYVLDAFATASVDAPALYTQFAEALCAEGAAQTRGTRNRSARAGRGGAAMVTAVLALQRVGQLTAGTLLGLLPGDPEAWGCTPAQRVAVAAAMCEVYEDAARSAFIELDDAPPGGGPAAAAERGPAAQVRGLLFRTLKDVKRDLAGARAQLQPQPQDTPWAGGHDAPEHAAPSVGIGELCAAADMLHACTRIAAASDERARWAALWGCVAEFAEVVAAAAATISRGSTDRTAAAGAGGGGHHTADAFSAGKMDHQGQDAAFPAAARDINRLPHLVQSCWALGVRLDPSVLDAFWATAVRRAAALLPTPPAGGDWEPMPLFGEEEGEGDAVHAATAGEAAALPAAHGRACGDNAPVRARAAASVPPADASGHVGTAVACVRTLAGLLRGFTLHGAGGRVDADRLAADLCDVLHRAEHVARGGDTSDVRPSARLPMVLATALTSLVYLGVPQAAFADVVRLQTQLVAAACGDAARGDTGYHPAAVAWATATLRTPSAPHTWRELHDAVYPPKLRLLDACRYLAALPPSRIAQPAAHHLLSRLPVFGTSLATDVNAAWQAAFGGGERVRDRERTRPFDVTTAAVSPVTAAAHAVGALGNIAASLRGGGGGGPEGDADDGLGGGVAASVAACTAEYLRRITEACLAAREAAPLPPHAAARLLLYPALADAMRSTPAHHGFSTWVDSTRRGRAGGATTPTDVLRLAAAVAGLYGRPRIDGPRVTAALSALVDVYLARRRPLAPDGGDVGVDVLCVWVGARQLACGGGDTRGAVRLLHAGRRRVERRLARDGAGGVGAADAGVLLWGLVAAGGAVGLSPVTIAALLRICEAGRGELPTGILVHAAWALENEGIGSALLRDEVRGRAREQRIDPAGVLADALLGADYPALVV